jgi:hypothetical protein
MPDVPTITLAFAANKSFQAVNPILPFNDKQVCPLCWARKKYCPQINQPRMMDSHVK